MTRQLFDEWKSLFTGMKSLRILTMKTETTIIPCFFFIDAENEMGEITFDARYETDPGDYDTPPYTSGPEFENFRLEGKELPTEKEQEYLDFYQSKMSEIAEEFYE